MTSTLPKSFLASLLIDRLAGAGRLGLEATHEGRAELGGHLVQCSPDLSAAYN